MKYQIIKSKKTMHCSLDNDEAHYHELDTWLPIQLNCAKWCLKPSCVLFFQWVCKYCQQRSPKPYHPRLLRRKASQRTTSALPVKIFHVRVGRSRATKLPSGEMSLQHAGNGRWRERQSGSIRQI